MSLPHAAACSASPEEVEAILREIGVAVPARRHVARRADAIAAYREFGRPVALKLDAAELAHKTELGGVILHLADADAVAAAFDRLAAVQTEQVADAGIVVEAMVPAGPEVILAARRDELFGPVLMLGVGGVLVELLEDVVFRLIPVTANDVQDMVDGLRLKRLFTGFRGLPQIDCDALVGVACRLAEVIHTSSHIREIEINPIIASGTLLTAVDCRVLIDDVSPRAA